MTEAGKDHPEAEWQGTALWGVLLASQTPDAEAVRSVLRQCMPQIETILRQGGTAPSDFTLHDSLHAFRVARRMAEIIPADVLSSLSAYELALLLLSAYLHDIGMTPEQKKVRRLHNYLLTGDLGGLDEAERKQFEQWLDDHASVPIPLSGDAQLTTAVLRKAGYLITQYSRHRHNDWSEEWIRMHLAQYHLGTYVGWLDDLVALCKSHHFGYEELRADRFDPRPVGATGTVVHLRYLAVALRISDILEFDPERTPEIVFKHRDIAVESAIYWWKDHEISLNQTGVSLIATARPTSAAVHRAVELTIDDVDRELALCRRLAQETHFEKCPGLEDDLPHRWDLDAHVHRDIKPREKSYDYIDGAFRPNTAKLLELLSGTGLYGSPMAGVRELLQNALDAVKEQIAYERLLQPRPGASDVRDAVRRLHRVELRLEKDGEGAWLICTDTGVGMTKAIIKDQLLVSGLGVRHEVLLLERRCREAGFSLGRTGEFGIGVLSYFMLADRVILRTQRGQEVGDAEGKGWRFETEGVGSFGELRVDAGLRKGTEVRLRLRSEVTGVDLVEWYRQLRAYVARILVNLPCEFQLNSPLPECESLAFDSEWVLSQSALVDHLVMGTQETERERRLYSVEKTPLELLSEAKRKELEAVERHWSEVSDEVKGCLRWSVQEGTLPGGLGRFRIHLPYFELPGGASLAFMRVRQIGSSLSLESIGNGHAYWPRGRQIVGWKGVAIGPTNRSAWHLQDFEEPYRGRGGVTSEINFDGSEAGRVLVSRHEFVPSDAALEALAWLDTRTQAMQRDFCVEHGKSLYASLNYRVGGLPMTPESPFHWVHVDNRGATWERVVAPLINSLPFIYGSIPGGRFSIRGKRVSVLPCLRNPNDANHYSGLTWNTSGTCPDAVVECQGYYLSIAPVWMGPVKTGRHNAMGLACTFPPKWKNLVGVHFEAYSGISDSARVWNRGNRLLALSDRESVEWCRTSLPSSLDPLGSRRDLLSDKGRAATWILLCLERALNQLWDGLKDSDSQFLMEVWGTVFGKSAGRENAWREICQWVEAVPHSRLRVLTPGGWLVCNQSSEIEPRVSDPGKDWTLIHAGDEESALTARAMVTRGWRGRTGSRA